MQFHTTLTARIPCCSRNQRGVRTTAVPSAEKHSRFTLSFGTCVFDELPPHSIQVAGLLLRIDWSTAQSIMKRAVERGLNRRSLDEVKHVGLDEKSFVAGQDYVSVMTDIDHSRVLEVTADRTTDAADNLWKTMSEEQRTKVKAVCMDMWQAYETSTERNVPQARIVHDRFHIAKYLNEAVDKVRRTEHRELQQDGDDRLKGVRQILLFNPENLSEEKNEELAALRKSTLATGRAWSLKELFRFFWQETDAVGGRAFFETWYSWAIRSRLDPIKKEARMLNPRLNRIPKSLVTDFSHGGDEGFNNWNQSTKPAARGFCVFEHHQI